ncbi:MAG: diaminopimelate decarboxylase [Bacteroidota bacterium]|nr:diaminopimelate decarboxylase [Bacteroidota bacterium]
MLNSKFETKFAGIPTPFYYYDLDLLQETLQSAIEYSKKHGYFLHYALKANADDRVLQIIKEAGIGADCVSGNEVSKALKTGFLAEDIFYAGVGKTDKEIILGLEGKIACFNCESLQEITVINEIAGKMGLKAKIALRINPNIESHTHSYITTGMQENKFGIQLWEMGEVLSVASELENISMEGLHFHIGSQITDLDVFANLCHKVNEINGWFINAGFQARMLNLGGGLGIDYSSPDKFPIPDFENYFGIINSLLKPHSGQDVHFELGRSLVAQMGSLITRVLYTKMGKSKNFVVTDAGMTELIRPALYNSFHKIENLSKNESEAAMLNGDIKKYDVVGPVCETSDFFAKGIDLPVTERGDILAIRSAGAYAQSMSLEYNLRDKAGVIYSDDLV